MVFTQIPKMIGFIYAIVLFPVAAYLWYSGRWKRTIMYVLLVITIALGFLILAPILPYQFQLLVLGDTQGLGAPLAVVFIGIISILALSFLFGRHYCGYLCPVGAVQEIAYGAPVPKYVLKRKILAEMIRFAVFVLFILAAFLATFGMLFLFGIPDFFLLILSTAFFVFVLVILISLFLYRPFCRLICPFGVLAALVGMKSIFKIRRTEDCIECGKCERACPTDEARGNDAKAECYLCGRCTNACPVAGALRYTRTRQAGTTQENNLMQ